LPKVRVLCNDAVSCQHHILSVVDEFKLWGIGGITLSGKLKYSERNLSQHHFIHSQVGHEPVWGQTWAIAVRGQ